MRASHLLLRS